MGLLQRLLGIERRPGEPEPLGDARFDSAVAWPDGPVVVFFFSLWCSECQVIHGLLNELGPRYAPRARFYRLDIAKNPAAPARLNITGVPRLVVFREGRPVDSAAGLMPIDSLQEWLERHIGAGPGGGESGTEEKGGTPR